MGIRFVRRWGVWKVSVPTISNSENHCSYAYPGALKTALSNKKLFICC